MVSSYTLIRQYISEAWACSVVNIIPSNAKIASTILYRYTVRNRRVNWGNRSTSVCRRVQCKVFHALAAYATYICRKTVRRDISRYTSASYCAHNISFGTEEAAADDSIHATERQKHTNIRRIMGIVSVWTVSTNSFPTDNTVFGQRNWIASVRCSVKEKIDLTFNAHPKFHSQTISRQYCQYALLQTRIQSITDATFCAKIDVHSAV